ncbi:mediator of RNA polymerase II transcription subunit 19a-like isoform X6 [Glycine soja]|uniref:mediator of RNA polymerase II transcription subunit 19a-like isoform X6 n=1 Tax=Glycine soja TaxID=3848 RepID=UPI0010404449|nr:mediator of RNA polymerase II transcription subunit 19a-like isoform X6 [Glycine soja]XP_028227209.1 mediator of RNA polymerase II transcription subunit 19a-like isoform X6 [Glycine soja]
MDPDSKKFGGDAHYLYNVVGDIEIRKGDGMQLDQLIQDTSLSSGSNYRIQPLDLDILKEAFLLKETVPIDLPAAEKGILTVAGKSKGESKDEEKKHKKHKDRDKDKDKEHKKHKHRQKDRSKDKEKEKKKDKNRHHDSSADPSKKHNEKKRKHDGDDDLNVVHKHKKSKVIKGEALSPDKFSIFHSHLFLLYKLSAVYCFS